MPGTLPWGVRWLPPLIAALAWLALYAPSLDYPFAWTDEHAIGGAGTLLRPAGETLSAFAEPLHRIPHRGSAARQSYYRPLPVVLLSLVDQRWGRDPRAFRSLSLGCGALCIAAFGLFAGGLFGRVGPALFASLFVALHPVGIEATVWIAGMPASLCALFVLTALACALRCVRAAHARSAAGWGLLSAAALALGLLSKERAAVEPVLLLAAWLCLGAERRARAGALGLAHAALVALYFLALRPAVLGSALGALPPIGGDPTTHVRTAIASWPGSIAWLFAPLHSSTSDAVHLARSFGDPGLWLGALIALGSALGCWALRRAGARIATLGLAWIWIAFAPTSGLLPLLHASGERYLYLSAFGAALLLADLGARSAARSPRLRLAVLAAAVLLLAGLAERSWARLPAWRSTRTLFEGDVARDPAYREAYFVLALEAFEAGRFAEAEEWITPLLVRDGRFDGTASYLNWLSLAELACQNRLATRDFEAILALDEHWSRGFPTLARAPSFRICVAHAHDGLGDPASALGSYLEAARELGDAGPAPLPLWIARELVRLDRPEEARRWLERAGRAGDPVVRREARELAARLGPSRRLPRGASSRERGRPTRRQ